MVLNIWKLVYAHCPFFSLLLFIFLPSPSFLCNWSHTMCQILHSMLKMQVQEDRGPSLKEFVLTQRKERHKLTVIVNCDGYIMEETCSVMRTVTQMWAHDMDRGGQRSLSQESWRFNRGTGFRRKEKALGGRCLRQKRKCVCSHKNLKRMTIMKNTSCSINLCQRYT